MKKINIVLLFSVFLFATACVTINVYFPAAEAEDAASKIVNKIIGDDTGMTDGNTGSSGNNPQGFHFNPLSWIVSSAHAQVNVNISSPAITEITTRMQKRYENDINGFMDKGVIGFSNEGFIDIVDVKGLPLKDRQKIKKLVADDNKDRKALYRELAVANGHADWEEQIRQVFIKIWKQQAHKGWKYQDAQGVWQSK